MVQVKGGASLAETQKWAIACSVGSLLCTLGVARSGYLRHAFCAVGETTFLHHHICIINQSIPFKFFASNSTRMFEIIEAGWSPSWVSEGE